MILVYLYRSGFTRSVLCLCCDLYADDMVYILADFYSGTF